MLPAIVTLCIVLVFLTVIFIRTALFVPKEKSRPEPAAEEFDREKAVDALAGLIRCRTVSRYDSDEEDDGEFEKLYGLLPKLYPHVYEACTLTRLPDRGLLFHWKGRTSADPSVMMAHYDVVPVEESGWVKPPFDAVIENSVMWGRGTLDTKVTFNGVLQAGSRYG